MFSFNSIKRNSINLQIAVAFFTLLVIIIGLQLLAYYWFDKLPAINELKSDFARLQQEQLLLKAVSNEFILKERSSTNFFATGKSHHLDEYASALKSFQNSVDRIQKNGKDFGLGNNSELQKLHQLILKYDHMFNQMIDKIKTRGYDEYGLIGEFDKSMMDLMVYDFGKDNVSILNLKLFIKEYLLTGNEEAAKNASNEIYNFSVVLEKYIRDDQVEGVMKSLGYYESTFQKLVDTDKELGLYTSSGLQGELFSMMTEIDQMSKLKQTNHKIETAHSDITMAIYISFISVIASAFLAAVVISVRLHKSLVVPINKIKSIIVRMGQGEIPEKISSFRLVDINDMAEAVNNLISSINDHQEFANNIGKGNLEASFNLLNEKDALGTALLNMRDNLKKGEEENRQRNWVTQGIVQVTDILQVNNHDINLLGDHIVSKLVKYLNVNQAGFYLIQDEDDQDVHLRLISCYAYERKKFIEKRIELGEGLLGQAILEKNTVYITNIPPSYIRITSGLGAATPCSLLIIPLKQNEIIVGALEIASLNLIAPHEQELAERIAENIAATVSMVRMNEKNKKLLEESQERAEILKAQEEEMRQQMEELQATQEQLKRSYEVTET